MLEEYVGAPEPHTTVVFVADVLDMRRRLPRMLREHAIVVECGGITSEDEARQWIRHQAAQQGTSIEPAAVALLARRNWTDVARLRADLDRVLLYAAAERTVTLAHVTDTIGSEMVQEQFAIADAISNKDVGRALRELVLILNEGQPPYMVLGQLRWVVESRMAGSHVRTAIEAVLRTDMALKTSAGDHRVLLERLVVELCDEKLRARPRLPGLPF
jgi:DNA polymerase III delta subunit